MKKILFALCVLFLSLGVASAQDLEAVTNLYNSAATALNEGKDSLALATFQDAQSQAETLGDAGAEIAKNCKNIIPKIYLSMGKTAATSQDNDKAVALLKTAIEMAKATADSATVEEATDLVPQLLLAKGNTLLNGQKFADAVEVYRQVCDLEPQNAVAALRLGMAQSAAGDVDGAVETLKSAASLGETSNANKQLSNIYVKKAVNSLKSKDFNGAFESASESVKYLDNANAEKIIGTAGLQIKKYDAAINGFESYIAQNPDGKDLNQVYYQIASAYEAKGNTGKACAYYKKVVNDPKFGQAATYKIKTTLKCN
jgi:tetratricopeptide (TPR) repeat protein